MIQKIKKAEILLDQIGDIDDALLTEAISYRPKRRSPKLALIAACIAMSVLLVLGTVGALDFISSDRVNENMMNNAPAQRPTGAPTDVPTEAPSISVPSSLDELFVTLGGRYDKVIESGLPYGSNGSYIVWQESDEDGFYICPISNYQMERLEREMGKGEDVGDTSPELEIMVWIISDGDVYSPYLKNGRGNIGIEVFDYDAEVYPTPAFISYVSAILQ